jgi:cysteine-rich repeat protein
MLIVLALFLCTISAHAYADEKEKIVTIYSSKSGYMSERQPDKSFKSYGNEKAALMYYRHNGDVNENGAIQYEWFDISCIPKDAKIISARLYKYHDSSEIRRDWNYNMEPKSVLNSQRVELAKLKEDFNEDETFKGKGKYKKHIKLGKIDSVSSDSSDNELEYEVANVVQEWLNTEDNHGFAFLGNYNTGGDSTNYYFKNAPKDKKPKLVVVFKSNSDGTCGDNQYPADDEDNAGNNSKNTTLKCGNGLIEGNELCDDADKNGKTGFCNAECNGKVSDMQEIKCGNSITEPGEECDDGNANDNDMCANDCMMTYCGDGKVQEPNSYNITEKCDSDTIPCLVDDKTGTQTCNVGCSAYGSCQMGEHCGDGIKNANETCDDGINNGKEGFCNSQCSGKVSTTPSEQCGNLKLEPGEECDDGNMLNSDGCSASCKKETSESKIYVISYVGDIDGAVSETWYPFFSNITEFYETNKIPVSFSFFPGTIVKEPYFEQIFARMYRSSYIELIQKGYMGDAKEMEMDKLSLEEQKEIIKKGQDTFRERMQEITGLDTILMPVTYDQIHGRFTTVTRKAIEELGFKVYFDVFVEEDLLPVESTPKIDVIQYGVSVTVLGNVGKESQFKTKDAIIKEIKEFDRKDVPMMRYKGSKVVPLWLHHEDFESADEKLDMDKWNTYTSTILELKKDAKIVFITPKELYLLRHEEVDTGKNETGTNKTESNVTISDITICTWKNCEKGAVSVSVDDYYTSCMSKLEAHGYRGTYFLSNTNNYTSLMWGQFNDAFNRGHEIGTHTQEHWCIDIGYELYKNSMDNNINDITAHTDIKKEDLITHDYPCGFVTQGIMDLISSNWNFLSARGYNFNIPEDKTPENFFNLKSFNSHGYPGGALEPPNYFETVDRAESQGRWLNLVFHNECSDDGVIDYLPTKSIWVDTIGNVVKYIRLRDSAKISDYKKEGNTITFKVKAESSKPYYKQDLTLKVKAEKKPLNVEINGKPVYYSWSEEKERYIMFDVSFPIDDEIKITT